LGRRVAVWRGGLSKTVGARKGLIAGNGILLQWPTQMALPEDRMAVEFLNEGRRTAMADFVGLAFERS
jgi:hypothetical protein